MFLFSNVLLLNINFIRRQKPCKQVVGGIIKKLTKQGEVLFQKVFYTPVTYNKHGKKI